MSEIVQRACKDAIGSNPSTRLRALEWMGCALGLAGAYLLACAVDISRYGWVAFFLANLAVIAFARGIRAWGLLTQQVGFMGSSLLGLYHAFWQHV